MDERGPGKVSAAGVHRGDDDRASHRRRRDHQHPHRRLRASPRNDRRTERRSAGRATVLSGSNQPSALLAMRRVRCRRWADRSVLVCKAWADRSSRSAGSGRTRAARRAPIGRRSATKTAVTGGPLVGVRRVGLDYFVGSAEPWSGSRWCVPRSEPVDRIVRDCGSYRPKVALRNAERRPAHQDAIRLRTWHRGDLV